MGQDADVADVVIVGAGPVGLTLANVLGLQGVRALVVDERPTLIDYPRGVGLDDEAIRTFQAIGLVDRILPHTVPNQILRFFDAKRRLLAEMAPPDARFGWPKRNGFDAWKAAPRSRTASRSSSRMATSPCGHAMSSAATAAVASPAV